MRAGLGAVALVAIAAVIVLAGGWAYAAPQREQERPVLDITPEGQGELRCWSLYDAVGLLPDPDGTLTIDDVAAEAMAGRFEPNTTDERPLGYREKAVWARLHLRSDWREARTWVLYPGPWGVAEIYTPLGGGFVASRSGAFVPPASRSLPEASLAMYLLALPVPSGPQDLTVYLRLENNLALGRRTAFRPSLHTDLHPGFARPGRGLVFLQAFALGVLLALGLYHLFLWTRLPEPTYLTFGLALLGRGILSAASSRLLLQYVWPSAPAWDYHFRTFEAAIWLVPFYLFLMTFLDTRRRMPRTHVLLQVLMLASFAEPVMVWLRPHPITRLNDLGWLVSLVVPVVVAGMALRRRSREAAVFLAANVVLLAYTIAFVLNQNEVGLPLPWWGGPAGELVSAVLFAVAVAEGIRRLRRESEQAHRDEARAALALKRRELESALLAGELSEARLQVLRNQLKPHFLFNTLNSISALMHLDVAKAERTLALLSELLRSILAEGRPGEVPLEEEVAFSRRYLEIEQTRFPRRLSVVWEVADEARDVLVPHLVLQPLVENAVRHGIAPRSRPGTVWVRAWVEGPSLCLEVRDDGVGPAGGGVQGQGVGLSNTRARLRALYGDAARLEAGAAEGGGFSSRVCLPLRRAEPAGDSGRPA